MLEVIKKLHKIPGPDAFTVKKFHQTFQDELILREKNESM